MVDLTARALRHGVRLSDAQCAQFEAYLRVLGDWSTRMNLVADADPEVVVRRHIEESIALGAALRQREVLRPDMRLIDIGSGAGFPGLVLKIVWPSIVLTLVDATAKKTAFLRAAADAVRAGDVDIRTGRAETLAHEPELRAQFDLVTARAVAALPSLLELTLPFARTGGRVAMPKGSRVDEEVAAAHNALDVLGGRVFLLPLSVEGPQQSIVVVQKLRDTPPAYPRRPGVPEKTPL
jgi:16S rRNA (guanine527-N7)-methyltransferase